MFGIRVYESSISNYFHQLHSTNMYDKFQNVTTDTHKIKIKYICKCIYAKNTYAYGNVLLVINFCGKQIERKITKKKTIIYFLYDGRHSSKLTLFCLTLKIFNNLFSVHALL